MVSNQGKCQDEKAQAIFKAHKGCCTPPRGSSSSLKDSGSSGQHGSGGLGYRCDGSIALRMWVARASDSSELKAGHADPCGTSPHGAAASRIIWKF